MPPVLLTFSTRRCDFANEKRCTAWSKTASPLLANDLTFSLQVLEDVTEYETGAEGVTETQMEQILLNGNNIAVLRPGGRPE